MERGTPAAPPPAAAAPAADPIVLKDLVGRWARLLADSDAGTFVGVVREGGLLHALFGAEALAGFARQVNAYDFDGALESLRRAAGEKGIGG